MSAAIAAAAIGGVAAIGGAMASSSAASKAADAQREGNAMANASSEANLAFQKDQYNKQMEDVAALEDIFGPVRENLSKYYNEMSPERFQAQGKEALEKQYQRSTEHLDAMFSNNGMYNSGQAASAKVALEAQRETAMGANQQNALNEYNNQQMNWLKFGTADINQNKGFAAGQSAQVGNAFGQQANQFQQGGQALAGIGMQQAQGWGQMASGGMQLAGYSMGGGFGGKKTLGGSEGPSLPGQDPYGRY